MWRTRSRTGRVCSTAAAPAPIWGPHFYEPTLLQDVREAMSLFADETFGPVVAISTFASGEEVVARANQSLYGLNFSVWTTDTARERPFATRLHAGTVNVNEGYAATWAPLTRRWAASSSQASDVATGATGSRSAPRNKPSRCSDCYHSRRRRT
jgi:succinate-semialdehyde dehydrogenase / glutarate-semialdehyde dehydrogenase